MSKQLGSIEVCCDAPPYEIVQTCRGLGIRSPEDVRWLRLSAFRGRSPQPPGVVSYLRGLFRTANPEAGPRCTCGRLVPTLEFVVVTFEEGEQTAYQLGQCARCRTVFWDVA